VGVEVGVDDGDALGVELGEAVGVSVAVAEFVSVAVAVEVAVPVGVSVGVRDGELVGVRLGVAVGTSGAPSQPRAHTSALSNTVPLQPAATHSVAHESEFGTASTQKAVPGQLLHAQHIALAARGTSPLAIRMPPRISPTVPAALRRIPMPRLMPSSISDLPNTTAGPPLNFFP
jgi:hypothetical protein